MKKVMVLLFAILLLTGCTSLNNTPKQKVEELFNNYQTLHKDVISQLDTIISKESSFNESQKQLYKDIIKDQYKNLIYEIKDSSTNGDKAVVTAEITVKDFYKVLEQANLYYEQHKDQFIDSTGSTTSKFIDYRLNELKNTKDKVKYTLEINVTLKDKKWEIDNLSSENLDKISGIYKY